VGDVTLQQLLGIELPIIQAPMAGAQGHALAAAVSNAGGLGSLPCALLDPKALRKELEALTRQTSRPYNVNFFCHQPPASDAARETAWRTALSPYFKELGVDAASVPAGPLIAPVGVDAIDVLADFRPAVVSFHFGLPSEDLLARVRALGARIVSSATTVDEARWLEAHGVDVIVAQGLEAGGHRGMFLAEDPTTQIGTLALLPQVVRAVRVPVVAAGGIADARGVAAAMALGAAGVQVGTAFLLCPEATPNAIYRAALKSEAATHTALTNVLSGRLARAISNRVVRELGPINANAPEFPLALGPILPLRAKAEGQGSHEFSALWCGQNASGCKEIPAGELTRELGAAIR
jgi:nitronate monooxygenase